MKRWEFDDRITNVAETSLRSRWTAAAAVTDALCMEAIMTPGRRNRSLTPREREVAGCVALGLTNKEIAGRLYLTVDTVKHHLTSIMTKLDVTNRTQVAAWILKEDAH